MTLQYNKLPKKATTFTEVFSKGVFYGRFRTNAFYWDWKKEDYQTPNGKLKDNKGMGIGGSFLYKTASLYGLSATAGIYTSQNPDFYRMDSDDVEYAKAVKDTFSRYKVSQGLGYGMSVLAQAYVAYNTQHTSIVAGRQLVESVYVKSNDTKMIPNTFDGVTLFNTNLPQTTLMVGYLAKQKLRDHINSHDILAYDPHNPHSQNDDSGVNKSLTVNRIGTHNKLLLASVTNKSIKNLKLNLSYAGVANVLHDITLEAHYAIGMGQFRIIPGVRYMQQFDDLHTNEYVASLKAKITDTDSRGYTNPKSLDTHLLALRVDLKNGAFLGRLGYSQVADEADIVNPWRGIPTGGFTRVMGQYNWYANTKTYMLRVGYDFSKAGLVDGFSLMARYAIQDFDDNKPDVQADSHAFNIDARQNMGKNAELKFRLGLARADTSSSKKDTSYNEYRLELNYFF
jgi:hypothetical protein